MWKSSSSKLSVTELRYVIYMHQFPTMTVISMYYKCVVIKKCQDINSKKYSQMYNTMLSA